LLPGIVQHLARSLYDPGHTGFAQSRSHIRFVVHPERCVELSAGKHAALFAPEPRALDLALIRLSTCTDRISAKDAENDRHTVFVSD
jgi:hypothetical protein